MDEETSTGELRDYRKGLRYHLKDSRSARVAQAFRKIAVDVGDAKYLVHGAETNLAVRDDETGRGLIIDVMTFLPLPEDAVLKSLDWLGAEFIGPFKP